MGKVKSNSVITTLVNDKVNTLTFTVLGAGPYGQDRYITLHMDQLSDGNRAYAALHGMKQRIADAAALSRDAKTGRSASASDKLAAMAELIEHYESGSSEWSPSRQGRGPSEQGLLFRALCEYRPDSTEAQIRAFIEKLGKADAAKLLNSDKIRPIADRMRAEAAKDVDADEILAGL